MAAYFFPTQSSLHEQHLSFVSSLLLITPSRPRPEQRRHYLIVFYRCFIFATSGAKFCDTAQDIRRPMSLHSATAHRHRRHRHRCRWGTSRTKPFDSS
ncbi:hypothetical protein E2C01_088797 [Portunus trituberculatus]|uniref:Uncharacterized protein n=1 Tax=Portunus trituberculatus TaxID=210409 RepID=A0A5B7JAA9_PORTR|nr:hypothetical protein [Portunus trituberculatus]